MRVITSIQIGHEPDIQQQRGTEFLVSSYCCLTARCWTHAEKCHAQEVKKNDTATKAAFSTP